MYARQDAQSLEHDPRYFKRKFPEVDTYQLSAEGTTDYVSDDGIRILSTHRYLSQLI